METKELRGLLSKRLYLELQIFKDSRLQQEKEDIYKSSYKIETYINLYEVVIAHLDNLQKETIRRLLNLKFGILESLYQEWLTREDCFYEEIRAYACRELEAISEPDNRNHGEGDTNGTGTDQAAQGR